MSIDLKLDENLDWDIYAKETQVEGNEKTKQQILTTLHLNKYTWKYNKNLGILYKQYILGQTQPNLIDFFNNITETINQIEGVISSQILDYYIEKNNFHIALEVVYTDNSKEQLRIGYDENV